MSVQESESTYAREEEELPSVLPQVYGYAVFAGLPLTLPLGCLSKL